MNGINLNSFKIFLEVANSNSFLEASNKLFLSQPAISKSMSKLEEDLGVSLFYRANKGISLTPSGEVLYKYLKDTKELLLSCERVLVSMNDIEESHLIIGVQSHVVRNYLMDKIDRFRTKHPKIKIKLIDLATSALIEQLHTRKVDFVVDTSPVDSIYSNINIMPICAVNTGFIKSTQNLKKIVKINDLVEENIVLPVERSSLRKNLNKIFDKNDLKINPILEFETEELIIDAVRRNLGVGYVVKSAVKYLVDAGIVEYVDLDIEFPKMEINLVYNNNTLSKVAQLFIEEEMLDGKELL